VTNQMKLLIVDDEPSVRKLLSRYFESRGFAVVVAEDGLQGWHAARDEQPDIVLTDVSMPEMDGYELTRTIRRNPATSTIPVILLSAHRESDAMVTGYECGADDYVAKPVDMDVLRHKIDALVRRAVSRPSVTGPALGKLICITSAKGGVGVTTLTANLSILLCRRSETVCAYDLNLEHGDLPVLMDMQPKLSIADLARDVTSLGDNFQWDDYLPRHAAGPRLLAAPPRPHDAAGIDDAAVQDITSRLRGLHDYVVADLPPGYGDVALSVYEHAERIVVVTSPELTSLRRTRELLGVLGGLNVEEDKITLVLNRVIDVPGIDARRVEAFLRRPVAISIPHGGITFVEAVTIGRPVVMAAGTGNAAVDAITDLAGLL
jgi:pilus assembly protein CpaE